MHPQLASIPVLPFIQATQRIEKEFDRVWPVLAKALDQDIGGASYNRDQVWERIAKNEAFLWISGNSAIVCLPHHYPNRKDLCLWLIGGKRKYLAPLYPEIECWAKANGFSHITGYGRKQWTGAASLFGFEPSQVLFSKQL